MKNPHSSVVRRGTISPNLGEPLVPALSPSVVYHYEDADQLQSVYDGDLEGFGYAREGHPNSDTLASKLSWMEGANAGVMTASGMSAISATFMSVLQAGDSIAAASQLYGRSLKMVTGDLPRMGFACRTFDASDPVTFKRAITHGTRVVLAEIVSNPMLRVTHFAELVKACKAVGALLLIDNTFTTPTGFRPLDQGADLVMHSVTKMLSGHSDLNLGYLGGTDSVLLDKISDVIATMGLNASPYNCWMAERGLNTFDLRFRQAQDNAHKLATFFDGHDMVEQTHYPGLSSHPDHQLASSMISAGYGAMVSFVLKGERAQANAFLRGCKNIPYGPTLGDVSTMVIMPAVSSHRKLSRDERLKLGIKDNLIRVSVGIEDFELIKREFESALELAGRT
ncbi:trans-sulfuration enzyme family protein [Shimia sp. MMG029]|uniref:trans-sulfuration enzyme family protein n=1 Tax=Shimia sp. MMG029 TaxID=3021978 RepID=UPI0022FE3A3E|nr:PLP-dependent transferase [Shimia sp. MMG029]MDA5556132.1 PLP-dependent transferase [Shimia sp. MMG029]